MNRQFSILSFVAALLLSFGAAAGEYANSIPAVQGYDVVSYQNAKRPVRGTGNFTHDYQGATYLFASAENQALFKANPAKYAPAYGGYCAFGVAKGKKFTGDPEVWRVVDGTLYLNLDNGIQQKWAEDIAGNIKAGDDAWKNIWNKSPASL